MIILISLNRRSYQARMTCVNRVEIQKWMQVITSQTERGSQCTSQKEARASKIDK